MLEALAQLGIRVTPAGEGAITVHGCGGKIPVKEAQLFLGNAGTAFRPLTAALALAGGAYHLSGVPRMHERPIGDLVDALRHLGADIACLANEGYPPLQIRPAALNATAATVPVKGNVSSQFLTGLLMALPLLDRTVTVEVVGELISKPYIEITLATMRRFGVDVVREGWQKFTVQAGSRYKSPGVIYVEGGCLIRLVLPRLGRHCRWPSARRRGRCRFGAGRYPLCRCAGRDGCPHYHGPELDRSSATA